jgi:hypothetical protein
MATTSAVLSSMQVLSVYYFYALCSFNILYNRADVSPQPNSDTSNSGEGIENVNINTREDEPQLNDEEPFSSNDGNEQMRQRANDEGNSTEVTDVPKHNSSLSNLFLFADKQDPTKSFKFFVVNTDIINIFRLPSITSTVRRTISKGTAIFVLARLVSADGVHWLKIRDGWIPEESIVPPSSNNCVPLLFAAKTNSRFKDKFTLVENEKLDSASECSTNEIIELQQHMKDMEENMERLTNSMLTCQKLLRKLMTGINFQINTPYFVEV